MKDASTRKTWRQDWPPLARYGFAIALVVISTAARIALDPLLGRGFQVITYFPAIAITALVCGSLPAVLAIALSIGASLHWIILPREGAVFSTSTLVGELNFAGVCALLVWLVHALRKAQEVAQEEAANNTLIVSSITDAFVTLDADWRVTRMNPRAKEIFEQQLGVDLSSALGRSHWELFPHTVGTIVETEYRRAVRDQLPVSFETYQDKPRAWFAVTAYPSATGLTILFRDVTERRIAEESRQRLAAVVESSDDAILTKSLEGRIITWNQGAERMFGYSAEEMTGGTVFALIPPDEDAMERSVLDRIGRGEPVDHYETRRVRKDGSLVHVSLTASPLRDADGKVIGVSSVVRDVTERKRAEEELRQQREWFSVTLASIGDAVIATDAQSRVTFLNPIAEAMTGWRFEEAAGKPLSAIFHILNENTRQPVPDPIAQVLRDKVIVGLANHTVLVRRDGKETAIEDSAAPIRSASGEILGVVMVFHDVTARREAEEQLRRTEQRLRLATKTSKVGVWDWEIASGDISWSESLYAIYDLDPATFKVEVQTFAALLHPDDRESVTGRIQAALSRDLPYEVEFRAVRSDGEVIWLYSNATVLREAGQASRMIGATIEITHRKRAEAELQESRNYFQSVVETSPALVMIMDAEGKVVLFNAACEEATGYRREEVIGKRLGEGALIGPWKPQVLEQLWQAADSELREPHVTPWITQSGDERWIEWRCTRVPGTNKQESFLLATGVDITERRRAEQNLAAARDAAEAANRAKDRFLAALSHELRTPLTPVLMVAAELARDKDVPQEYRQHFETIRSNVELEARLIDDLLDVTRITAGKLQLRLQPREAHKLIRKVLAILDTEIQEKQLEMELDLSAPNPNALADEVRLQQVFWNVLRNAVKFTERGGRITVRTRNEGDKFVLEARDTGIGLAQEDLARIFDAFVQADAATEAGFGGLGLGLSISALLMKEQSGRIWASSEGPGHGATFHIEIPLAMDAAPAAEEEQMPAPLATGECFRILVVEDHEATRATLTRLLGKRGHQVENANSIAAARIAVRKNAFDLVISDVGLPDGDGRILMQEFYQHLGMTGIALSGYGTDADVQNSLRAGFGAHLTKPVDFAELDATIARLMRPEKKAAKRGRKRPPGG